MSDVEIFLTVLRGRRPDRGLLHSCRLHAYGSEVYGEEATIARLASDDSDVPDDPVVVARSGHIALFSSGWAAVADVADGGIARIWRLGSGARMPGEARVSVAFDPDLSQAVPSLFFDPADHPALDDAGAERVALLGMGLARMSSRARVRAFAIRAFGDGEEGAALFACYHRWDHGVCGFVHHAVHWHGADSDAVFDEPDMEVAASTPWTPRV
jgi:hypothetical protein